MSLLDYLKLRGYPDENDLFFNPAQFHPCREDTQSGASHGLPPVLPATSPRPDFNSSRHRSPGGGFPELVEK